MIEDAALQVGSPGRWPGQRSSQYRGDLPMLAKWILVVAMLLGRLEIFTVLVLFTPAFWRK
ncbi:hypothetical protein [Halomonas sp. M4R1S46]|uniref:hypothetical protein n=1 Tax=Halomonas sp. M4R1S46 TaxID=2982692 RepID=UPI0021E40E48|nr:hypothetical protein [Halomonas sp. M4R1S46]UYG07334.1 hypothetical protein OCT48_17135 [Halomonas sp. M4R1S46]